MVTSSYLKLLLSKTLKSCYYISTMLNNFLLHLPNNIIGLGLLGLVFILGFVLIFSMKKSQWIIYALLVWFPLESLILMYTPIEYFAYMKYVPEIVLYGLVVGSMVSFVMKKYRLLPRNPLNRWFVGIIIISLLSLVLNWYSPWIWVLGLRQLLRFALVLFVIMWMRYDSKILRRIIVVGAVMIILEIILGLIQYVFGGALDRYLFSTRIVTIGGAALIGGLEQFWTAGSRVFATMGRYDRLGSLIALGLIMAFPWIYSLRVHTQKVWYGIGICLGIIILILTYSRASWIAACVGVLVIGLGIYRDKRVAIVGGIVAGIMCIYLVGFAIVNTNIMSITEKPTQSLAERVFEAFSFRAWEGSYEGYGRIFFIINTPRMVVTQYPLFGVGPGQYGGGVAAALLHTDMYDRLHMPFGIQNRFGQIDNNWMSIWGEFGTIGLIAWFGLFISVIKMSRYVYTEGHHIFERNMAEGLIGLTIGIMCIGFFGPYFEFRTLMFYYWSIVGIVGLYFVQLRGRGNFLE